MKNKLKINEIILILEPFVNDNYFNNTIYILYVKVLFFLLHFFIFYLLMNNFLLNKSYVFAASLPPRIKIISLFVKKALLRDIL